jgi:hypothetical protein
MVGFGEIKVRPAKKAVMKRSNSKKCASLISEIV